MTIEVAPTLERMAHIYRLSAAGGAKSERFAAYVAAGQARVPVHGYNPMTSKPVLVTVDALIEGGAEGRLKEFANQTATTLGYRSDDVMHFSVAAPGMWTDRLATEVEHRFLGKDPGAVLLWFDDACDPAALRSEIVAQTFRLAHQRGHGPPATLANAVRQEGGAGDLAGREGRLHPVAAEALDVLGNDASLATMVAFFYGDDAAATMGFAPLGFGGRVGYEHAIALNRVSGTAAVPNGDQENDVTYDN